MTPARQNIFDRSIRSQIQLNQARTPTQRLEALFELHDSAREMAPRDAAAGERRRRARQARRREREEWRAQLRRLAAAERAGTSAGI